MSAHFTPNQKTNQRACHASRHSSTYAFAAVRMCVCVCGFWSLQGETAGDASAAIQLTRIEAAYQLPSYQQRAALDEKEMLQQ